MLGLSGYDSSDDESGSNHPPDTTKGNDGASADKSQQTRINGEATRSPPKAEAQLATPEVVPPQSLINAAAATGPQLGPSMPEGGSDATPFTSLATPASHASTRQAIRNLTLPPVPNFDIPPSPPGSPPPGSTEKFTRFLDLKKKGVHFNEKLENSSALRNPSLLQKLRVFAGIDDEEQYESSLSEGLSLPTQFPSWAYAPELNKLQAETTKTKEKQQKSRSAVDFVPSSTLGSGSSSRSGTPGVSGRTAPKSAAERVMAGLNSDKAPSPAGVSGTKRADSGQRKTRFDPR